MSPLSGTFSNRRVFAKALCQRFQAFLIVLTEGKNTLKFFRKFWFVGNYAEDTAQANGTKHK